jgi:acyl-coenzyme A synthetase/AMP-(fatty) acid ligase
VLAVLRWGWGDSAVPGTVLLFMGRWVFLLPLIALVPAALWLRRGLLVPLALATLVVVGPIMGFRLGWRRLLPAPDGTPCEPNEVGELVHRGSLVSLGYWNDPQKTAERFKPAPGRPGGLVIPEVAVWSGDQVRKDEDGYLYFVGRRDEMIKTSGYRVSPTEIEEVVFATGLISDAAAVGVPHPTLGQAVALVVAGSQSPAAATALLNECKKQLPAYMVPAHIDWRETIPRNANGKYDRALLARELSNLFAAPQ